MQIIYFYVRYLGILIILNAFSILKALALYHDGKAGSD